MGKRRKKHLRTRVRYPRVGIHDTCRKLGKLSDVPHKKNSRKSKHYRHIQRLAHIVAAFDRPVRGKGKLIFQKITSVISRHQTERLNSFLFLYFHFQKDGLRQSLLTHGFHNPCCSKDGKTAQNPKSWIECLLGKCFPLRRRNGHFQRPAKSGFPGCLPDCFRNHLPWHLVDGRRSYRLLQPRLCHPADPLPAFQHNPHRLRIWFLPFIGLFLYFGKDEHSVGNIRIISCIFPDRA